MHLENLKDVTNIFQIIYFINIRIIAYFKKNFDQGQGRSPNALLRR